MSRRSRMLAFEQLDSRQVLAVGPLTAEVDGGNLLITGGNLNSAIAVWGGDDPGEIVVAGANQTTVNGQLSAQTFSGVDHLQFDLRGGADQVLITNLTMRIGIGFGAGRGNDRLILRGTQSPQDFATLNEGSIPYGPVYIGGTYFMGYLGNDTLRIFNATTGGITVDSPTFESDGNDLFEVDGELSKNSLGRGDFGVNLTMGSGDDVVRIKHARLVARKDSFYYALAISDSRGAATVDDPGTSSLIDLFDLKIIGRVRIFPDWRYASCVINIAGGTEPGTQFEAASSVELGAPIVNISHASGGHYRVRGSGGSGPYDNAVITDSVFASLFVDLFVSDDRLTLQNVTTTVNTELHGGSGTDTYVDGGGKSLASFTQDGFEVFE
jgi:hypothetical protein